VAFCRPKDQHLEAEETKIRFSTRISCAKRNTFSRGFAKPQVLACGAPNLTPFLNRIRVKGLLHVKEKADFIIAGCSWFLLQET